jgi:hypothetical protein
MENESKYTESKSQASFPAFRSAASLMRTGGLLIPGTREKKGSISQPAGILEEEEGSRSKARSACRIGRRKPSPALRGESLREGEGKS